MGDIGQKNLEFTEDIIELKTSKLFKESEISNISQNRKRFDYKINGTTKLLQDIRAAIQYENSLLLELMKRRRIKNVPMKMQKIDFLIIERIQNLYSTAMVDFPEDYEIHLDYYNFLRQYQSFNNAVNDHVRNMIKKFENNPQVFRVAASKTKNNKEAIEILLRGLSQHPLDTELYIGLIELELKEPDEYKVQEKLRKYIDDILKNISNHIILIEILKLVEFYPNLLSIQNYIVENLLEKYQCEEDVWHIVALRELKGLYYKATPEEEANKTSRKSIKRCIARYKEGISKLSSKKQPALWNYFLGTVIDIQKENPNVALAFRTNLLKQTLDDAKRSNIHLDENHWECWIDACGASDELLVEKLEEATREQPHSTISWSFYLKHYILKDSVMQSKQIFKRAIKSLGPRATFIWDMYIDYHLLRNSLPDINDLYKEAVSSPYEEIANIFKPRYLTWTVLTYSIAEARKVYWEMANRRPYCKELHEEMLQIEMMELDQRNLSHQLQVTALYAKQFGHEDVDVWIQWMSLNREQRGFNQNEKEREILGLAMNALPERMVHDFREKYNTLPRIL